MKVINLLTGKTLESDNPTVIMCWENNPERYKLADDSPKPEKEQKSNKNTKKSDDNTPKSEDNTPESADIVNGESKFPVL